jgi:DNA mismatch repair ATPase MutL
MDGSTNNSPANITTISTMSATKVIKVPITPTVILCTPVVRANIFSNLDLRLICSRFEKVNFSRILELISADLLDKKNIVFRVIQAENTDLNTKEKPAIDPIMATCV